MLGKRIKNDTIWLILLFHFHERSPIQTCVNAESRRDISEREIFYSKGPLALGATCCTALGFPLTRLRGTCFARPIPNALAKIDSLILILGRLLIGLLFLPTLAAYLIDFAIVCTVEMQTSEIETKVHARYNMNDPKFDFSMILRDCIKKFD